MIDEEKENELELENPTEHPKPQPALETFASHPVRQARRRQPGVVSIGSYLEAETEAEKNRNDLLDLVESMKSHRVLSGTIQGVERPENSPGSSLAVLYHGDFKVIIPAEEMVTLPEDLHGLSKSDALFSMVNRRMGAEVDYVVKGIDQESGLAAASRLEAMAIKRREYYYGAGRDGNNLLYEGVCAEARVVSVLRGGVFVELFGVEAYIPLRELSYQRLLEIHREDRDHIRVAASVKQAGANPYEKALKRYSVGNRYVGTVSMVDTTGVFVALDGGVDCLCSYPKRGRPPRGARVTVRILGINHETNRIWGVITHASMPH